MGWNRPSRAPAQGVRQGHLYYAPLAECMGRVQWASEVFNCSAPDSGNIELLQLFASPAQRERWLDPLLRGEIRSCFAMSEPDIGSSDPTQLQTSIVRRGDELVINGHEVTGGGLERVSHILDIVRGMANVAYRAEVITENNFPSGAGIASSASAFAALALASSKAAGLTLSERELSRLARRGSGSAARSVPGGFVEWQAGISDEDSFAFPIAPADYWDWPRSAEARGRRQASVVPDRRY